jgi:hypothetical protein
MLVSLWADAQSPEMETHVESLTCVTEWARVPPVKGLFRERQL